MKIFQLFQHAFLFCVLLMGTAHSQVPANLTWDAFNTTTGPLGVFGGSAVSQAQYDSTFPFLVQPNTQWQVWCTATLIAPRWVLFAAHCINNDIRQVRYGSPNAMQGEAFNVIQQIGHPEYQGAANGYYADVALIQVDRDIPGRIASVLGVNYHASLAYSNQKVTMVGWGITMTGGAAPSTLFTATATHTQWGCTPGDICVQGTGTGVCGGDSGGPLLYQNIQIGVASRANCEGGAGTYAETELWGGWVLSVIGGGNPTTTPPDDCVIESWCLPGDVAQCQSWVNAGECGRNPAFMHACCKRECGLC